MAQIRDILKQVLEQGDTDVATAGTPVQLSATELWVSDVIITAKGTNAGSNFYVAFSSAAAISTSGLGVQINGLDAYKIKSDLDRNMQQYFDLSTIWIDVATSGDGVVYQFVRARGN